MKATHQFELNIFFSGIEHSDAIREYIEKKLEAAKKILSGEVKTMEGVFRVEVGRTTKHHRTGDVFHAEITYNGGTISARAIAEGPDLYAALDEAKDELERELTKARKRGTTLSRHGGQKVKEIVRGQAPKRKKVR